MPEGIGLRRGKTVLSRGLFAPDPRINGHHQRGFDTVNDMFWRLNTRPANFRPSRRNLSQEARTIGHASGDITAGAWPLFALNQVVSKGHGLITNLFLHQFIDKAEFLRLHTVNWPTREQKRQRRIRTSQSGQPLGHTTAGHEAKGHFRRAQPRSPPHHPVMRRQSQGQSGLKR